MIKARAAPIIAPRRVAHRILSLGTMSKAITVFEFRLSWLITNAVTIVSVNPNSKTTGFTLDRLRSFESLAKQHTT